VVAGSGAFVVNSIIREKRLQMGTSAVSVGPARILLRPFQLVVWATLQRRGQSELDPGAVWLPCVVDTGFNGTFCIADEHVELLPDHERFQFVGFQQVAHRGGIETARRLEADLWIRSEIEGRGPIKIELPKGCYAVSPRPRGVSPGVPLVGQAALCSAGARLEVDYQFLSFSLHEAEPSKSVKFVDVDNPIA
jgi:hypothetical protein